MLKTGRVFLGLYAITSEANAALAKYGAIYSPCNYDTGRSSCPLLWLLSCYLCINLLHCPFCHCKL